jgi:hypothetical protein
MKTILAAALLGSLLAPPLHARQGKVAAQAETKIVPREAASNAAPPKILHARPALWLVKDKDTTIYLFGTIHMMKPQVAWFEGPVRTAYEKAGQIVLEVTDDENQIASTMLSKAVNPEGMLTSSLLSEESRAKLEAQAAQLKLSMAVLDRMKPWFVALTLSMAPYQKLGYDPKQGVDAILKRKAAEDGKTLTGLETTAEQLGFLDSIPQDQQVLMLSRTLDELDKTSETLEAMVGAWARGDPQALGAVMNKSMDESPEIAKRLLFDRNAHWAQWIRQRLEQPGTVFLAVGAGHLAGDQSLQEKLGALGIKVQRLKTR